MMTGHILTGVLLALAGPAAGHAQAATGQAAARPDAAHAAVEAALADSTAGWNAGDLDRFLAVYSTDPATSFTTKSGVVRGLRAVADRYRASYDFTDIARRGRLGFAALDVRRIEGRHLLYVARYTLTYPDKPAVTGTISLVFRREARGWRIIADHSS